MFNALQYNNISPNLPVNNNIVSNIKTIPISSSFLFDTLNNYKTISPDKYNLIFINDNIPNIDTFNTEFFSTILNNNINININTLEKCISILKKKSILSSKINDKLIENNNIYNILKHKLNTNKNNLSYTTLNNIINNINIIKFEKQNLTKLHLLNKYKYLQIINIIFDFNNNKSNIKNNCHNCKHELLNTYNISPDKLSSLHTYMHDFTNNIKQQYGGKITNAQINKELESLSPKLQKTYEYFKVKDDSITQLKLLENKLQNICKNEKNIFKCIDSISNKLTNVTNNNEQIEELELNYNNTLKLLKQKENLLNQLESKSETDFIKYKDELSIEFKELQNIKNQEIDSFKNQIKDLSDYKLKYDEELKKNKEHLLILSENQTEIDILTSKVNNLDNSKNILLEEYNTLINSGNEYKIKFELKQKELDYINNMFSDLSEREVKLQEKNIEYEKLKKKYDDVQNTINEFSKNLDVIAENKKKLLDRLKSLEDMNLLLSNNTFSNIFKEPIVNSSPDATVRDLNKRKSALELTRL